MNKNEEIKINKMPKINTRKDVKKLFEPGNFLYNLIYECKDYETQINKFKNNVSSEKNIIKQNAMLENIYQNYTNQKNKDGEYIHDDWLIHNTNYAIETYKRCGFHIFKPTIGNPNDMLTSNINESEGYKAKDNINFQAVMHTIGNTITAKMNWKGLDFVYNKLNYIMLKPKKKLENHEAIKNAYLNNYKSKNKLLRELYLVDAWDYENKCPKIILDQYQSGTINANTKFIIQRGYRMQRKYQEPEFTPEQKNELQIIFDYFGYKDRNVI